MAKAFEEIPPRPSVERRINVEVERLKGTFTLNPPSPLRYLIIGKRRIYFFDRDPE